MLFICNSIPPSFFIPSSIKNCSCSHVIKSSKSLESIVSKTGVIEEIARQTNLLALNASVEATRAGEHGKGFSVVVNEVRKLAERSQDSLNEINELSQLAILDSNNSVKDIQELLPNIEETASLILKIKNSNIAQRSGAEEINNAIDMLHK